MDTRSAARDHVPVAGNQSVRGMLLRRGPPESSVTALWLLGAAVLAVLATLGAKRLEDAGQRLAAVGVLASLSIAGLRAGGPEPF